MPKHVTVYYYADQLKERKKTAKKKIQCICQSMGLLNMGLIVSL